MSQLPPPPPPSPGWQQPPSWQQPPPPPAFGAPYPASAYPTYGATPYGYSTARPLQSLRGLAVALCILFPITAVACIASAVAAFHRASVISDNFVASALNGDVHDADNAVGGAVGTFLVLFLTCAVLFIIWQYRHAQNAERLAGSISPGPGWAIGGWFIPFANYVVPELQLYRSAAVSTNQLGIVVGWWVTYAAGAIVYAIGRGVHPSDSSITTFNASDKIDQFASADRIMAAGFLVLALAAVLAAVMVWRLTQAQAMRPSSTGEASPGWAGTTRTVNP